MKLKTKLIAVATTSITVISAIAILVNNKIFKNAENTKQKKSLELENHIYNWKFGKVAYKTIGEGEPLLLVHSQLIGSSSEEWSNNIFELSKNNKVYLIDMLGYGDSERGNIQYSAYLSICLVNDFISEVIKKPTNVVGSNLSASIVSMAYIFNCSNFKKICLISPTIYTHSKNNFTNSEFLKLLLTKIPLNFFIIGDVFFNYFTSKKQIKKYIQSMYASEDYITEEKINTLYACSHKGKENNKHLLSAFMTNKFDISIETALPEIDTPLLIIYGKDFENLEENINSIKSLNPNSKIEIINGKAYPNEEDSIKFNNILKNF